MKKLATHYNHHEVEDGRYLWWKEAGYFKSGDLTKPKFSLVIPPPNVTGKLHLGHAWDNTFQDIIARYKKAQGFDVFYLPGTDHAGIATQAKIEERLRKEKGLSRYDLGRENFLKEAWAWKEEYANTIHEQWAKLGLMLDYDHERFTLDENLNKAVNHTFVELYKRGYLYRGEKIINWDPVFETALSNIEVIHKDVKGKFYYFKYYLKDSDFFLSVATTRPETMFADVALIVNPLDERYSAYVGKTFINPVNGEEIPLLTDGYVDLAFGTGVMKCTPAHDANDFKIGETYNLARPICINTNGTLNKKAGEFNGLDRFVGRTKLVKKMEELGLLIKIEEIKHSVGHSERSGAIIEPYLSKQWFLKMDHFAAEIRKMQEGEDSINFYPKRFNKTLINWMNIAEDWCVSRQIWWGHRIPAYYHRETGEVLVTTTPPEDENFIQDSDVLDTWFSSALWPFSTFGWPAETPLLERYFPTDVMVTGYDIIFFWVSRMIFMSLELTGQKPFKDVVIHGLIRDEQGRKMSKSLGNGIDPGDVISEFGIDSLRYFLATTSTPGQDSRYSKSKMQSSVNYLNKIWNASRFVLFNLPEDFTASPLDYNGLTEVDQFLLHNYEKTVAKVSSLMDKYDFGLASRYLYDFVYDDFCSNYLEMIKVVLNRPGDHTNTYNIMYKVLRGIIMMIYPFSPFISEEIYLSIPGAKRSIMEEEYPRVSKKRFNESAANTAEIITLIKEIRSFKSANSLAINAPLNIYISNPKFKLTPYFDILKRLCFINEIKEDEINETLPLINLNSVKVGLEVEINSAELIKKLEQELQVLDSETTRATKMLANPGFLSKAPAQKIKEEETKLAHFNEARALIIEKLKKLR